MADKESAINLIRKLLALSTSSNPNEAAAAAAKAQELLLKHHLDMSMIETHEDEADMIAREDFVGGDGVWQLSLMSAVAKAYLCRVVRTHERNPSAKGAQFLKRYAVFGRPENIEITKYLYTYLQREIKRLCTEAVTEQGYSKLDMAEGLSKSFAAAFRVGAVVTIKAKLEEGTRKFEAASDAGRSLIVVTDAALSARVEHDFPDLKTAKTRNLGSAAGYYAGREAAQNIQIRTGIAAQRSQTGQVLLS